MNSRTRSPSSACPPNLPDNWTLTSFGEVTSPRDLKVKPEKMPQAPFVGLEHIEAHTMRLLATAKATEVKSSGSYFEQDDIIYGRLRPYLNKVYMPNFSGLASGEFIVFPNQLNFCNAYLKYFLNQWEFVSFATRLNAGDRPRVEFSQFSDYPLPLPPLPEQHRIVAEIEKQFTRLDASVAALKRAQANLKRYRASVLQSACEGTLVPTEAELARAEGRDYETAESLVERILAERRARWESQEKRRSKYKEQAAPDTAELSELPEGWVWATVEQLAAVGTGSTPLTSNEEYYKDASVPWVTSSALNASTVSASNSYVTEKAVQECRLILHPVHTLLVAMYGEGKTRGKCSELLIPSTINQAIAAVTMVESAACCRPYAKLFLHSNYEETRRLSSGGVQPNLNLGLIKQIAVPLPPLAEQLRIVAEVERRLSVIQQSEVAVETSLARAERLRQSILKQAFSGLLVPQDPNDEPASVLLERVKAEREAAKEAETAKPRARRPRAAPSKRSKVAKEPQLTPPEVSS